jgi:hypothetical protein
VHVRRNGRFRVAFPVSATPGPCDLFVITAHGASGDTARLAHRPPECNRP